MKILHIAAHMGDGAGKAIGGLARMDSAAGNENRILLLQEPQKLNHIEKCRAAGIEMLSIDAAENAIAWADVVILNWWGGTVTDRFLQEFPRVPCRVLLWTHKNGFYDPPLAQELVDACDGLLVTSPLSLTKWPDATLVYGFGDFDPKQIEPKTDYSLRSNDFIIGYVGMPGYKRFPPNAVEYFKTVLEKMPNARFVLVGEYDPAFRNDLERERLLDRVDLTGWASNVYERLQSFDVFGYLLKPDTSATTENSVLEAMAVGLPIIISREPVGRYILGEGNGFFFDCSSAFATSVQKLAESLTLRREMGKKTRIYACETYRRDLNLRRFRNVCESAMLKTRRVVKWPS